jgi:hypothetical protein
MAGDIREHRSGHGVSNLSIARNNRSMSPTTKLFQRSVKKGGADCFSVAQQVLSAEIEFDIESLARNGDSQDARGDNCI